MPLFRDHLLRLDSRSRHDASAAACRTTSSSLCPDCFGEGDLAFGAFFDGAMRGVAELRSSEAIWFDAGAAPAQHPRRGGVQRRSGLSAPRRGETCSVRIASAASNHGVKTVDILCAPDNVRDDALARKFKMQLTFEENQITGRLTARRPSAGSLLGEAARDAVDFTGCCSDAERTRGPGLGAG